MKKFVSIVFLLLCFVTAFAKAKNKSNENSAEPKTFMGEWKINGAVKKLYDTPLGEVFKFSASSRFSRFDRKIFDKQINSIQFELFKNSKEREEVRRFIVIDLKIRVFPASSEVKNPSLSFSFTRSMNAANSIKKYGNINGISSNLYTKKNARKRTHIWRLPQVTNAKRINNDLLISQESGHIGLKSLPAYETISMRFIVDTNQDGFISSNTNERLFIQRHHEFFPNKRYPVYSFGILIEKCREKRRFIVEFSRPKITFTDNETDLPELEPVKPEKYPYSGYVRMYKESKKKKRNLKRLDNPDAIYGHALNLLEGKDLVEGIKLLRYIAKKHEHILAMNQLGICYWRGIGVKADNKEAVKWFRSAGKYDLQDALAYGGALSLKRASKPYIGEHDKKNIYYALNHIEEYKNVGKHSTSVLFAILNQIFAKDTRVGGIAVHERSAKLAYWIAKNNRLRDFYKNSIYEDKGIAPKDAGMTNEHIKNKYYDIRNLFGLSWHVPDGNVSQKAIDDAVEANFPAAIYFKGQLLIAKSKKTERESAVKQALSLFERGEKLGDLECAIEVLHSKARLGQLSTVDFNAENFARFFDHPLYYLLQYIVKNPNLAGAKEFLNRDYRAARRIWRKKLTAKNNFLLALEGIYQYYHYGADTAMYRIYYGDIHDIKVAYKHLNAAVKANIQDAIYLKGVYYLNKKYNSFAGMRSGDISAGTDLLRKIAPKNIKAQYYLIKNDFYNNKRMDKKWLKQLKPLRDLNFPDAWMLSSDIFARSYQGNAAKRKKVIAIYKKAAVLGCVRAWDRLAMLYYKNGRGNASDRAAAEKYWKMFLEADKKQRRNDPFDPYWPKPKPPKVMTLAFGTYGFPGPAGSMGISFPQLTAYLRKHYKIIGSLEKDKQRPPNKAVGGSHSH